MAIYVIGYLLTGSNKNYGTILAVLIILPTAQFFARYMAYKKYASVDESLLSPFKGGFEHVSLLVEILMIRGKKKLLS